MPPIGINRRRSAVAAVAAVLLALIAYGVGFAGAATPAPDPVAAQYDRCQADLKARPAPTGAYLTWLTNCVRAFAPATASPSPSLTPSTTSSPSATPTVGPTTAGPSPSTTPPAPTTTPPAPTTAPPSPSPTPSATTACMDNPAACGFPDATNTGVPPGTLLASIGSLTLSMAGATYSGLDIHGCVTVAAAGVTLTRSLVSGCAGSYAVRVDSATAGFVMTDSEIVMQGDQKGLVFVGYTAQRVKVTGTGDCFGTGTNSVIVDSFCENGPGGSPKRAPTYGPEPSWCEATGAHWDGVEAGATTKTVIRHNTFRLPCGQTGTINVSDWNGAVSGVVIDNNLLAGGSWTVYCGSPTTGVSLTNNRFSRWYWPGGGSANADEATQGYCWTASRSGNVWDEDGKPV